MLGKFVGLFALFLFAWLIAGPLFALAVVIFALIVTARRNKRRRNAQRNNNGPYFPYS